MTHVWSAAPLAHPVFASVSPWARRLAAFDRWPTVAELDDAFRDRLEVEPGVRLEAQVKTRRKRGPIDVDALYERRVHQQRVVPTRERSWHDLANALVWCAFPRAKRALVARQSPIVRRWVPEGAVALPSARTREQDALALLDEGGIVLASRDPRAVRDAQRTGDTRALAAEIGSGRTAPLVFGHALMEHTVLRAGDVRGYGVALEVDLDAPEDALRDAVDAALARWIDTTTDLREPAPWPGTSLQLVLGGRVPSALDAHR